MKFKNSGSAPFQSSRTLANILKTTGILLVAFVLCELLFQFEVGEQIISIVMVLVVFITAAFTDGYWYGLFSTLAAVLIYDYLEKDPRFAFSFTLGFPITFLIMLLVSLVTSTITARVKEQAQTARKKEQRAELLYDVNRKLLSCREESAIARYAIEYLKSELRHSVALFTSFDGNPPSYYFRGAEGDVTSEFFITPAEWACAKRAAERQEPTGAGTASRNGVLGHYRPVINQNTVYGVFGVSCGGSALSQSQLKFLDLIIGQTAQALRVQALTTQQQEAKVMAETEKTRNSFLRSISHDLRTPLTSIIGASATFLENRQELSANTQVQLIEGIQADSQWLLSMVENILSVTRIHKSDTFIEKTEEAAEEIVGEAVALFRRRYPTADITIQPSDTLLLVPMDALLITQVINNLLDNAQRHRGQMQVKVTISLRQKDGFAHFCVTDTGPGIKKAALSRLFDIRPANPGQGEDAFRGLGIGLSICKTIVEAHGGWIKADNLPGHGARFIFALPMERTEEDGK